MLCLEAAQAYQNIASGAGIFDAGERAPFCWLNNFQLRRFGVAMANRSSKRH